MKKQGKKEEKEVIKLPKLIMKEKANSNKEHEDKNEFKDLNENNNVLNKKRERAPIAILKENKEEIYEEEEEYDDEYEEEYDEEEEDEKTEKNNNERIKIKMKEEKDEIKEKITLNNSPFIGQNNNDGSKEKDKNENQEKKEILDEAKKEEAKEGKDDKQNPKDVSQNDNNQNNLEKNEDNKDKTNNCKKKITLIKAQQSIKEFMGLLLETEEKIKSKYGNCLPDFSLEEELPLDWQKKLLLNFFQSEEMNNIASKMNEEKNM